MINRAEEDYLKAIYALTIEEEKELAETPKLVSYFGFSNQSINDMIKKLESKKYVKYEPYKGVRLTNKGLMEAIRLVRAHRIWELFLTKKLGFNWADVHADAENLEHSSSERVIERLSEYLGNPKYCQHGNPIPAKDGSMAKVSNLNIYDLNDGERFKIVRVSDQRELLLYLDKEKIKIYDEMILVNKDKYTEIVTVKGNDEHFISYHVASKIYVERI